MSSEEIIDREAMDQLKNFIRERFAEVVETYLRAADTYIATIHDGYAEKDAQKMRDAAHPMKSSAGNLGLCGLSTLCREIEETAFAVVNDERDFAELDPLMERLQGLHYESSAILAKEIK